MLKHRSSLTSKEVRQFMVDIFFSVVLFDEQILKMIVHRTDLQVEIKIGFLSDFI